MTEDTVRLRLADGTDTGDVPLSDMREALNTMRGHNGPPLKNTPEDEAVRDRTYEATGAELRQYIEQFELAEAEKKDAADRGKEVMAEAKARGFDTKVMRKIVALRKRDKDDVAEEAAILEMYCAALGMA